MIKTLVIKSLLSGDFDAAYIKLGIILIMWGIVIIAMIIDLIAGVHKAKQLGIESSSFGFSRTVTKFVRYFGALVFALLIDVLMSLFVGMPYVSAIVAIFLVFIEGKSVLEKADQKVRRRATENINDLLILFENKDDLVKGLAQLLKKQRENGNFDTSENSE